jgi:hypothetical protein
MLPVIQCEILDLLGIFTKIMWKEVEKDVLVVFECGVILVESVSPI